MVKLLMRRWFGEYASSGMAYYSLTCPNGCGEYYLTSHLSQGCADFVTVTCENCGAEIGRIRDDWSGDRKAGKDDLIRAN